MDFGEEAGGGQAAVTREGVGHARGGGHDAGCCEEEADEGEAGCVSTTQSTGTVGRRTYIKRQMDPALLPVAL